jgi:hypothetical protein
MLNGLTRRDVLKLSLAAGAVGVTAPLLPGCKPVVDRSGYPHSLETVSDLEFAVLTKAAEVVLPPPGVGLPDHRELPIVRNVDHQLSGWPSSVREQVEDGLTLFEYGAILLGWHFKPFTRLGSDQARDYLVCWRTGHRVQKAVYGAITRLLLGAYWQEEVTWEPVGYGGPAHRRVRIPSLGNAPLPEERA